MKPLKNEKVYTVIGVPSTFTKNDFFDDYFCFDCTEESLKQIRPKITNYCKSDYYKNLYQYDFVPNVPLWEEFEHTDVLLEIKFTRWGIINVEKTNIRLERIDRSSEYCPHIAISYDALLESSKPLFDCIKAMTNNTKKE